MQRQVNVQQVYNPDYVGPDHTPDIAIHVYQVQALRNVTTPKVGAMISEEDVRVLIASDIVVQIK